MTLIRMRLVPRNFHDEASLATELTPATGFPVAYTQNCQRSRVWRSSDGTDQYLTGRFEDGLSRKFSFFGLFRHRCAGGKVRLQLYSDANFTTEVYDSTALDVINVVPADGTDWGVDPYGSGPTDPFLLEAPFWLWFAPTECLSYKITFTDNDPSYGAAYWQVCRVYLGNFYEVDRNPDYGATLGFSDLTDRNRSRGGSLRTNIGPIWRVMNMDFNSMLEVERAVWIDVLRYCGTGRDFVLSLFPEEGTRRERDHVINAKFVGLDALGRQVGYLTKRIQLEEV